MISPNESFAQTPTDEAVSRIGLRCEVYCSQKKLRTVNAKLTWIGPGMPLAPSPLSDASRVKKQRIETTVFKNGFKRDLYAPVASFEPNIDVSPEVFSRAGEAKLPAYDLRLIEVHKTKIFDATPSELAGASPEEQEQSISIEGLEPGLKYYWRLRFETDDGWLKSETAVCEAPVCPADFKDGD